LKTIVQQWRRLLATSETNSKSAVTTSVKLEVIAMLSTISRQARSFTDDNLAISDFSKDAKVTSCTEMPPLDHSYRPSEKLWLVLQFRVLALMTMYLKK